MTKRDYIKAAKIVCMKRSEARSVSRAISNKQRLYEENVASELEEVFIQFFADDNPRFDRKRFADASAPKE
jgi:hypothetical protein